MTSVQVILPCLNEAEALPSVLRSIDDRYRVLVIDNGSDDDTAAIARRHGAVVIGCARRGYGSACHAGLEAADADVVVVMDADGSLDGGQLSLVVDPVLADTRDLMIGTRHPVGRRAWARWQRLANRELARQIRRRTGVPLSDLGPMRAARRTALLGLGVQGRRSGYPAETVVTAADAGWRIGQVAVDYRPRIGRSKVTGTPVGALRAVRDMRRAIRSLPAGPAPAAVAGSSRHRR